MDNVLLFTGSLGAYALAISMKILAIRQNKIAWQDWLTTIFALIALYCQAILLHRYIDLNAGQNLSPANLFSLITWLAALLLFLTGLQRTAGNLCLLVFPLGIIALIWQMSSSTEYIVITNHHWAALWHVLLSTLIVSIMIIAGLQASLLALQEKLLQKKRFLSLLTYLPSLQVMEQLLFRLIWLGFIGLSLLMLTSLWLISQESIATLWHKLIATAFLWSCLAILLIGRYRLGWRGTTAVILTSAGVALAMLLYLGSHFLLA